MSASGLIGSHFFTLCVIHSWEFASSYFKTNVRNYENFVMQISVLLFQIMQTFYFCLFFRTVADITNGLKKQKV